LARLAVADADAVDLVADHDQRREREPPAALDHLCDAVDLDDALLELSRILVLAHAQNFSPPSRAPSASALTRPWYRYPARSNTTVSYPAFFARSAISFPTSRAWSVFVPLKLFGSCFQPTEVSVLPSPSSTSWA